MLLTITYRGPQASDLGFLLHKHPSRAQRFDLSFGKAYVFYPAVEETVCTAALLLDLNPIDLARGKVGTSGGGLFDYINDRPYVCSSFLSSAIVRVFSSAMRGQCKERLDLAETPLDLEVHLTMLPCRGDAELVERLFQPLGYAVSYRGHPLDETFPEWGESDYVDLTLRGTVRLQDLLNHLFVLIPVFDNQKHYWMTDDEVEKLLRHGEGWLPDHPEMKLITRRYFSRKKGLANRAIERLLNSGEMERAEGDAPSDQPSDDSVRERRTPLNEQRLDAVVRALRTCGAHRVADLGCGEGRLLQKLMEEKQITRLTGMDVSLFALARARDHLHLERAEEWKREKVTLFQGSLTYRDKRLEGHDAICLVEVLEHMDADRLPALERTVFRFAAPRTVVVTTPNAEYNKNYARLNEADFRHPDHRFEWTRAEFQAWAETVCQTYGYTAAFSEIGEVDEAVGAPTQMGVFTKCG